MSARHLTILWVWIPKRICSGWPKFCFGINFIFLTDTKEFCRLPLRAYTLRASPLFRSRHSPRNCRVGVEQQFYPLRRSALRQVLLCELVHRRDERLDADDRFESIAIRLPLVIAREGIYGGHQQKGEQGRSNREQWQVCEIGELFEHVMIDRIVKHKIRDPKT